MSSAIGHGDVGKDVFIWFLSVLVLARVASNARELEDAVLHNTAGVLDTMLEPESFRPQVLDMSLAFFRNDFCQNRYLSRILFFLKTFGKSLMANLRNIWLADVLVHVVVRVLVFPKTTLDVLCRL